VLLLNIYDVQEVMKDYRSTVTHADMMLSTDLSANMIWLETYMKTLDQMDANLHRFMTLYCSVLVTSAKVKQ